MKFLLTNLPPRHALSALFARFSRINNRVLASASIAVWRRFAPLDLSDSADPSFRSLHDCFTRRLRPGARPVDPDPSVLASPCDAIVGATGRVENGLVLQVKNSPYPLAELLGSRDDALRFEGGTYVTFRLTASMYHRFHTPDDIRIRSVTHLPGERWNVNGPTVARVRRLYCRNERAVIRASLDRTGEALALVPVAAILVGGIRLGFLDIASGRRRTTRDCDVSLRRGEEVGWFEHGSTIVLLAPPGFAVVSALGEGAIVRAGAALLQRDRGDRA